MFSSTAPIETGLVAQVTVNYLKFWLIPNALSLRKNQIGLSSLFEQRWLFGGMKSKQESSHLESGIKVFWLKK